MNTRCVFALIALVTTSLAHAAGPGCEAQAAAKRLSGAAKNSFVTKCQKDAAAAVTVTCEAQAAERKLAGAAKTSFVNKCQKDAAPSN